MDLDEWEILGFRDYYESDHGGKKSFASESKRGSFDMDYFVCPSSPPRRNSRILPNKQLVAVPFELEPTTVATTGKDQEVNTDKKPVDLKVVPSLIILPEVKDPDKALKEADQDQISQVFFKKLNENKFVDMKLDSPDSPTKGFDAAGKINLEDHKTEVFIKAEKLETEITSPLIKSEKEKNDLEVEEVNWDENNGGSNFWKWSLNGIGAICSFGVAAATVCIIIFGSQQRNKQQRNQKLRFQIYTDDKRIKQVVQHTTVRGVPIARAEITYGGYYEGL